MAIKILMPALSPTMTEGNLIKWFKKEGDIVKPGELIAEIETDKATMEVESADSGTMAKILIEENTPSVKVNSLIAVLKEAGDEDKDIELLITQHLNPTPVAVAPQETKPLTQSKVALAQGSMFPSQGRIFASPLAKRIATEHHINLSQIKGTGPGGRIIKKDVLGYSNNTVSRDSQDYQVIPLTSMRKTIAKRLLESKQTIPHFYMSMDCDVTELEKTREIINSKLDYKISINDFIVKACACALKKVPQLNTSYSEEGIIKYNNIDICVAVATEDGLITPILQNADQKTIFDISKEIKSLAQKAKSNELKPHEFMGGTFTISNLGMYGIKEFNAIINPPQSAILAVGATTDQPLVKHGAIQIGRIIKLTISCDHRVVDGAVAANFMAELKICLEQPAIMFVNI